MGELTGITWTDSTFNPWVGCQRVSAACDFCYAEAGSRRLGAQHGLNLWQGDRFFTGKDYWKQPGRWNRAAEKAGERRRVFCASFADVFEDNVVLIPKRVELCQLIEATPWLDWLLLTKRPQNIANMVPDAWLKNPLKNVWYGTTCEDQEHAEERVPHLLSVPAAVHFVSYEPALGPVDFTRLRSRGHITSALGPSGGYPAIDWLIVGGESGPKARPFDVRWARWVREQCESTGTAFFMKQLGSKPEDGGTALFTVDKKGGDMLEWPPEIRVREFPRTA